MKRFFFLILSPTLILSGCSGSGGSGAVGAVQSYYQAIIAQDTEQLQSVTCPEFLDTAQVELDSFQGVKIEMEGFSCQSAGTQGSATLVKCSGKIVAAYGSEKMDFPLDDRVHEVQKSGDAWQVCGY